MRGAETAMQTLNGRKIFNTEIRVNWAYQNQTSREDISNHNQCAETAHAVPVTF
jgi:nucleolysin TIA-1/TIAR